MSFAGLMRTLSRREWMRLGGFGGAVAALHIAGWGLFAWYSSRYPALAGLGVLAYTFGLRHAFDADHIAAIDSGTVQAHVPAFSDYGSSIGAGVSGTFLWIVGILNLVVLLDIVRIAGEVRRGRYDRERLEQRLEDRGFMSRFFLGRFFALISKSWHMYPLGILFGLGFDTATEVGLLALAAGVANHAVPFLAVLSLPILFAAGMSLMDTADGAFMSQAYGWAFSNPVRKIYYNITVTSLSVTVALAVGSVELLQVFATKFGLDTGFWAWVNALDFEKLGYVVVGLFVATWAGSVVIWKARRIDERWGRALRRVE